METAPAPGTMGCFDRTKENLLSYLKLLVFFFNYLKGDLIGMAQATSVQNYALQVNVAHGLGTNCAAPSQAKGSGFNRATSP